MFSSFNTDSTADLKELLRFEDTINIGAAVPRWQQRKTGQAPAPIDITGGEDCRLDQLPSAGTQGSRTPGGSRRGNGLSAATSKTPISSKSPYAGDRFIPTRGAMDMEASRFNLAGNENHDMHGFSAGLAAASAACSLSTSPRSDRSASTPSGVPPTSSSLAAAVTLAVGSSEAAAGSPTSAYRRSLKQNLFDGQDPAAAKVLAFRNKAPAPTLDAVCDGSHMRVLYSQNKSAHSSQAIAARKTTRHIPQAPERILDAPDLVDDYYLNLLDWSASNVVAIALGTSIYMWDANTGECEQLLETSEAGDFVTSVAWIPEGSGNGCLAVGTNHSVVQLWDVGRKKCMRTMRGHTARVSSLAWNRHILSSGSRDSTIMHHDVRVAQHVVGTLHGHHQQEVCGMKWSPDGSQLASGGNDNLLMVWDGFQSTAPRFSIDAHCAAVKALAWCPWQSHLLASGGGHADRHLRFWNTQTGACVSAVDTQSQVCSIVWNKHDKELVTSHGFTQNQLCLWKYPSLTKVAELTGHTARVLHMSLSPDGTTVASAAADESLRFWKIFQEPPKQPKGGVSANMLRSLNIR